MLVEAARQHLGLVLSPVFFLATSLREGRLVRVLPLGRFLCLSLRCSQMPAHSSQSPGLWTFSSPNLRGPVGRLSATWLIVSFQETVQVKQGGSSNGMTRPIVKESKRHRAIPKDDQRKASLHVHPACPRILVCKSPCPSWLRHSTAVQTFDACTMPTQLTSPNPKYVWTPNAVRLKSQKLSDRVFAVYDTNADSGSERIPSATSGGFVVGDQGVLLVEKHDKSPAILSDDRACPRADRQTDHACDKHQQPRRSQLWQHIPTGGCSVVQHQRTAEYIAAHFSGRRSVYEDELWRGSRAR